MKTLTIRDYMQMALVAAIYVVLTITPPLNALAYGAYQFRVSEMLNFLAFYNRKYIWSVTIGCMIANFYSFGLIDVFVGGLSTFIFVSLGVKYFERFKGQLLFGGWMDKAHFYFSLFFAASMFTVAAELAIIADLPFFATWLTTGIGEWLSLLFGAVLIRQLAQRMDLTK